MLGVKLGNLIPMAGKGTELVRLYRVLCPVI